MMFEQDMGSRRESLTNVGASLATFLIQVHVYVLLNVIIW